MDLLKEYLNEFDPYINYEWERQDNFWLYVSQWNSAVFPKELWELKIISKWYWFIRWLVKNNKIDWWKVQHQITALPVWLYTYLDKPKDCWKSDEMLIMRLANDNEPIEYLISILK